MQGSVGKTAVVMVMEINVLCLQEWPVERVAANPASISTGHDF